MEQQKKPNGIRRKLFAAMLSFSVLLLLVMWFFQAVFLDSFYKRIRLSEAQRFATALSICIENGDTGKINSLMRERGDIYAEIINSNGENGVLSDFSPPIGPSRLSREQKKRFYDESLAEGGALILSYNREDYEGRPDNLPDFPRHGKINGSKMPNMGMNSILLGKIVEYPGGEKMLLLLNADLAPVDATVRTLKVQLVYISLIMVGLSLLIAFIMARRVSRPIIKLNESAKALGKGDYGSNFKGGGYREIDELAQTLNKAAAELSKTDALRRELIANVSHDLRTPLTLIEAYAEMVRDIPGESSAENMQVIIDESRRLSVLVSDLLKLSQIEAGVEQASPTHFNLTMLVRDILSRFSKLYGQGCNISFICLEDANVIADSKSIGQVIYNLLINAAAYSKDSCEITVEQSIEKGRVKIEIRDNGDGIPADMLPHIWDRYFKGGEFSGNKEGSGLGLSIVKGILDKYPNALYGVESQPEKGSCFWFSLEKVK